jgi:glutamate/tyrosine decarboxylase-like PLP-dependent enzyme
MNSQIERSSHFMTERQLMGINLSLVEQGLAAMANWERNWPALTPDETLALAPERASEIIASLVSRLEENYPFFHPAYAGQMLKPAHAIATTAYFLTQQVNPNNHALDGGPATAGLERETIASLATMVGFDPATTLGHLTSSGTIANLEALWVARQLHHDKAIAFSSEAHYTHGRMCEVIGVRGVKIATTADGRMDLADLRAKLETENIGTVVATTGTTSLGAVDAVDEILDLAAEFGFRIHVDAAFGGFFSLLAQLPDSDNASLGAKTAAAFNSISRCDSVVIDPHKHALQPYGCGSVLFKDASVGRFYKHDSPYTYFTSADLHLGEISLECSRAGAAAAAFWATLQAFPLETDSGLGPILKKCRQAATLFASLIEDSSELSLVLQPGLDIVVYYPTAPDRRASSISAQSHAVFEAGMVEGPEAFFLAKVHLSPDRFTGSDDIIWDQPTVVGLRSVLMKPEHLAAAPGLYERITRAVRAARDCQSAE